MSSGLSFAESYFYNSASGWYENQADYSLVNAIVAKSNITQADVDKFKLVWLGQAQNFAAAGIGAAAVYKGGTTAYQALDMLGSYGPSSDNKFWWALAGAAGIGFGVYKTLYTRLETGILGQIKTYVDMCQNLDIYSYYYSAGDLHLLGTSQQNFQGEQYNSAWMPINAAWLASNIARKKGMDNLLEQGRAAIKLISQLEQTTVTKSLNSAITEILKRLDEKSNNYQLIAYAAQLEAQDRKRLVDQGAAAVKQELQLAQQKANVAVAQQTASALWWGKIVGVGTAMSNFVSKSLQTLVYVNDNKEKIAGGLLIGSAAVYGSLIWLQSKLTGN